MTTIPLPSFFKTIVLLLVLQQNEAYAQSDALNFPPPAVPLSVYAVETTSAISIDGKLSEPAWQTAPVISDFFRMEPRQSGTYRYPTFVQILFDKKNIYFGVFCKDSAGKKGVRVQDLRRDFTYGENDVFYLQLDPQNLKRFCVSFQTTPYGNQRDLQVFDDALRDNDWNALWKVRTTITDSGYYAEFAIPFKSLRYDKQKDSAVSWGLTLARLARRDYEVTVFPKVPQAFSPYRMNYSAELRGLKLPPPSANIRVQPYSLYQYSNAKNSSGVKMDNSNFKAGGEVKWAINPRAVLDLTFNTDFAQADVDRAVNNLTRFNVFFPERRQFFLENSGIYAGANNPEINPFFSRTIGLANTQFNANPVPIDVGVRYTERNVKRALAGLYVRQRSTDYQGSANFFVARYLKNYGKQNNIGFMVTHRLDEANKGKGFLQHNNTTINLDGFLRPDNSWTVKYLLSLSRDNVADSIGLAGRFSIERSLPKWYYKYSVAYVNEKYVPGMGYIFANNTVHHNPGGYYIWRPKSTKLIRRWDPGFFLNYYHNATDGKFQQAELDLFPVYTFFKDNSLLTWDIYLNWQRLDFPFRPLGISFAKGNYQYVRNSVAYASDASKKVSASIAYEWGGYFNGKLQTLISGLRIAPLPNASLRFDYTHNQFKHIGINRENLNTDLYSGELRLAYNPRIQASVFYQYNSFDQRGRWNARGSWEFAPLSFLYIVFNETNFKNSLVRNQSVINKITYLKQF